MIVFLVLLVIGNLDYTDVFPFVEKHKKPDVVYTNHVFLKPSIRRNHSIYLISIFLKSYEIIPITQIWMQPLKFKAS